MVPQPGVDESVRTGTPVEVSGLVYRHGVSQNGRAWEMFTARAIKASGSVG
jgi:hypothetical protein